MQGFGFGAKGWAYSKGYRDAQGGRGIYIYMYIHISIYIHIYADL